MLPLGAASAQYPQSGNQPGYQQGGGWDAPPSEFTDDIQRRGFHEGIEAARADFANHVQPSPEGHEEFRHPQVPYPARDTYRDAYKRGYFVAVKHMQERREGEQPVPQPNYQPGYQQGGGWDAPPGEYSDDLQRHAFHDGIEAARADFANHVQPSPEGHEEYRHPQVPFLAHETYRNAFKRGYFLAVQHMQERGR